MADIAVQPFVLKDCMLTVEADNYEAHVSQVQFDPSSQSQSWQGLTPAASFTDAGLATWAVTLAYAQDWVTPAALSRYLFEHEGESKSMTFAPKAGGPSFTAEVTIAAGSIGGTVNQYAVATVTLPVSGKPTLDPLA
ncbi:hypothetical protein [Microbacterium sp. NPDC057650]|uniref:hypothetical protein n=1 Tax=unclassified Microbacterium TaxID=2609290 RepID=UPI00366E6DF1